MERPSVAPTWLRWLLVFAALGFVTLGLAVEAVRIADIAGCVERAQAETLVCPAAPGASEIALTMAIEVVVVIVAAWEVVGSRR